MPIEILLDSGSRGHHNVGDVALLIACHDNLRRLWPQANFSVLSEAPERLARLLPEARAVPVERPLLGADVGADWRAGLRRRRKLLKQAGGRTALLGRAPFLPRAARGAIEASDIVAMSGCGLLTDRHAARAARSLALLREAEKRGKVAAMFGQGIGPITARRLRRACRATLPRLDILTVREPIHSTRFATDAGADPSTVVLTGEEAVEMANAAGGAGDGRAIGVVLRIHPDVDYLTGDEEQYRAIYGALDRSSRALGAPLFPIHTSAGDMRLFRDALAPDLEWPADPPTPREVIDSIAGCRLVVTFSYHAAVFALSQGIPTIGLVRNPFSRVRFAGLADAFGAGLNILSFSDPRLADTLERTICEFWDSAADHQPALLESAHRQIERTHSAYDLFHRNVHAGIAS